MFTIRVNIYNRSFRSSPAILANKLRYTSGIHLKRQTITNFVLKKLIAKRHQFLYPPVTAADLCRVYVFLHSN